MTATAAAPPVRGLTESFWNTADFTGTGRLLRLYLRRDRIVLPLWVLLFSLPLGSTYVKSTAHVYSSPEQVRGFAHTILSSPAQLAMYGPVYNQTSAAAVGLWKAGMFFTLIGIATILTVIRHTRAEEETGREELLASTRIGRAAGLTAALILACSGALVTGLLAALSLMGADVGGVDALAFGLAMAGSGIVFAAVAAVTAQLSANARTTRAIAFAVLAGTYVLRAVGDARAADGPTGPLVWLSPQGWSIQVRALAGNHFPILALHAALAVVLIVAAYVLLSRRDVGAGLLAERLGSPVAGPALAGPFGLAWRLQRGALAAWTVGLALYGLVIGSVVHGIADQIGSGQAVRDVIERLGGSQVLEQGFLYMAFSIVGVGAAAYSVSAALRLHAEEEADRAESVLTGAIGRIRWAGSHLLFAFAGPAVALLISGGLGGLVYGLAAGDVGTKLPQTVGAAMIQLPAVWIFTSIAVALFGLLPRWASVAWGVLAAGVAVLIFSTIPGMPQWIIDLNPFGHLPKVPAEPFRLTPVMVLIVLALVIAGIGLAGLRRRDMR
ncbi:MAG: ABC transporter permease [Nocardia sp.]|nr:ABC transporter permease [Nocardia sp.]